MDTFTIVLVTAAGSAIVYTAYGLLRPRAGHRINKNSTDDANSNTARMLRQGNIHNDSNSGFGSL